jgi:F420H(2)-dependent biliverdin reductase
VGSPTAGHAARAATCDTGPQMTALRPEVRALLESEQNAWLCTLRPDGSPHVTPVWFVYRAGTWWLGSSERNVKVRNVEADARVAIALADAGSPVVAEGRVRVLRDSFPPDIVKEFAAKYDGWDVTMAYERRGRRVLLEIEVERWLLAGTAQ